jgi:hypothetical protein
MSSVNRIITAKDYAIRERAKTVREMVKRWSGRMYQRGQLDTPFVDGPSAGTALAAKINHGQWVAHCDQCSTPMWVDPDDPFMYCYGCGNRITGGRPRPVLFPEPKIRQEIESLLLQRPVDDRRGTNDIDRAFNSLPLAIGLIDDQVITLDRSWEPHEQLEDLRSQNALIEPLIAMRAEAGMSAERTTAMAAFKETVNHFSILGASLLQEKADAPLVKNAVQVDVAINLPDGGKK